MATWLDISDESYAAALVLEEDKKYRSAVSRYYYAAFSAMTFRLLQRGAKVKFSAGRETPGHAQITDLIDLYYSSWSEGHRSNLIREVKRLYTSRLEADYSQSKIDRFACRNARQRAGRIRSYLENS
jgi:uncharacterized protein (UPF0332 family)